MCQKNKYFIIIKKFKFIPKRIIQDKKTITQPHKIPVKFKINIIIK